jgi:rubredoxin
MKKHGCVVCGYVYNPILAARSGVPKNTQFDELSEDWCCPQCGTKKKYFVEKTQETNK